VLGQSGLRPCTPTGSVILAKSALGDLTGKHCVVLGRSILVGKPAALMFLEQNCTVTMSRLHIHVQRILLTSAAGQISSSPQLVDRKWYKPIGSNLALALLMLASTASQALNVRVSSVSLGMWIINRRKLPQVPSPQSPAVLVQ